MTDDITLDRSEQTEISIEDDPVLLEMTRAHFDPDKHASHLATELDGTKWDAPLDLKAHRPIAYDLRRLWAQTQQPIPPHIDAVLGSRRPILLQHVFTPMPTDGKTPARVWALGYDFAPKLDVMNTVSLVPSDEVIKVGSADQTVELGLQLGGRVGVPDEALEVINSVPGLDLHNAKLEASTNHKYQLRLKLSISFRKVVAAPYGTGGADWQIYRQDERLDRSHALYQTVLVEEDCEEFACTVGMWAKQGGWFGGRWGARSWKYSPAEYVVSLR